MVKKQAKKHLVRYTKERGVHEQEITVTTGRKYFCWDQEFFPSKEKAEAHKRQLIKDHNIAGVEGWTKAWGIRVFKTQKGWGVFAEV
jgi:ABC-type thiamine transport system substrate-binding protein